MRMSKKILVILVLSIFLVNCKKELTENEKETINNLNVELSLLDDQINSSNKELNQYSGGLIKTILNNKLEILKINQALIQQRIHSIESGAPIKIEITSTQPNLGLSNAIKADMDDLKKDIKIKKEESNLYSGGLIKVTIMLDIAQKEQTLTSLQTKYYTAKYGLSNLPKVDYDQKPKIKESDPSVPIEDRL